MISAILLGVSSVLLILSELFGTVETTLLASLIMLLSIYLMLYRQNRYSKGTNKKSGTSKFESDCIHTELDCEECFSQSNCLSQKDNLLTDSGGE